MLLPTYMGKHLSKLVEGTAAEEISDRGKRKLK
jgi:hypothetical protein